MNVIITGGSRGIGRATVELFQKNGHNVVFLYLASETYAMTLFEETGAVGMRCDVRDPKEVSEAVERAVQLLGGIDVLINNAGVSDFCFFDEITDEGWRNMIDTNLSGAFYVTREVSRYMIAAKKGAIVNVGSMWGKTGASCEVHYSASKAGLRGMTKALAKELGPSGIRVNCVEPGVIATDMNARLTQSEIDALCEDTPLGRVGTPREVAELILFLSSEKAAFITGQTIGIDGGFAV